MKPTIRILVAIIIISGISCKNEMKIDEETKLVLDSKARLGEGAIWNHNNNRLYWIDIEQGVLNIFDTDDKVNKMIDLGQRVGTVVPAKNGDVLLALQNGIFNLDEKTQDLKMIVSPEDSISTNRFNDGKCDPKGRFWVGSMSLKGRKGAGSLYKVDHDLTVTRMLDSVTISNGIAWSPNGKKMYYIDTPTRKVMEYNYDLKNGTISHPRVAIEIPDSLGMPDGSTIDSKGNLWIAMWGGSMVTCWELSSGKLLQTIDVPVKNVTSCAFGGQELDILFITTARQGLSNEDLKKYPNSGGIFAVRPGVKGIKANFFGE